jgi:hypothetical protein
MGSACEGGILSQNATTNPHMAGWNVVYTPYCDGSSFTGGGGGSGSGGGGGGGGANNDDTSAGAGRLHFQGRFILRAAVKQLLEVVPNPRNVVVAGCSAGGLATMLHLDTIVMQLEAAVPTVRVRGLADAGFFLDLPDLAGRYTHRSLIQQGYTLWGSAGGLDANCEAAHVHKHGATKQVNTTSTGGRDGEATDGYTGTRHQTIADVDGGAGGWECLYAATTVPYVGVALSLSAPPHRTCCQ